MASKRINKKREPRQGPDLKRLRKFQRRADAEVARLLKRTKAGTITRVQLQTGLEEVEDCLDNLHFYWL
jgi:hypothetical protein